MSFGRLAGVGVLAVLLMWVVTPRVPPAGPALSAPAVPATVTLVGRPGSFGPLRTSLPSGQRLDRVGVPGWALLGARKPGDAVIAVDGTVMMPAISHNDDLKAVTSPEMSIVAYDPRNNTTETIRLSTTSAMGPDRMMMAPTVTALLPLPGGAVAFIAWTEGLDTAALPSFGLLTKVDGHWQALPENRFSGKEVGISKPQALTRLPASGDLIVAQQGGRLTPIRVTGPDLTGRYSVQARPAFDHPDAAIMSHITADPTGKPGAEVFAVDVELAGSLPAVQEFSYDSGSGALTVVSAPLVPGDKHPFSGKRFGYRASLYDPAGNLWAARDEDVAGGRLAVYTGPRCQPNKSAWAIDCQPTYDIAQGAMLPPGKALMSDPATSTIVMLTEQGFLMPVRAKASRDGGFTFEVGNLVDIGLKVLTDGEDSTMDIKPGAIDRTGRLWLPASRGNHNSEGITTVSHWLLSVNLDELFAPPPTRLSDVAGQSTVIQAENTTNTTTRRTRGATAKWDITSETLSRECDASPPAGCGFDNTIGNGFYVAGSTGSGFRSGTLTYRVQVPIGGNYWLRYHASTSKDAKDARIALEVGDHKLVTTVATNTGWASIKVAEPLWLEAGLHTLTVTAPPGGEGWFLNYLSMQRA